MTSTHHAAPGYDADYEQAMQAASDEHEAISQGRATALANCYRCAAPSESMDNWSGPLRGVVREFTTRGPDPYAALVLTCGHTVI